MIGDRGNRTLFSAKKKGRRLPGKRSAPASKKDRTQSTLLDSPAIILWV